MELNYDYHSRMTEKEIRQSEDRDTLMSDWKLDITQLKGEIKIQEMLVEFFKGEMFRLIDLCARNGINPNAR